MVRALYPHESDGIRSGAYLPQFCDLQVCCEIHEQAIVVVLGEGALIGLPKEAVQYTFHSPVPVPNLYSRKIFLHFDYTVDGLYVYIYIYIT